MEKNLRGQTIKIDILVHVANPNILGLRLWHFVVVVLNSKVELCHTLSCQSGCCPFIYLVKPFILSFLCNLRHHFSLKYLFHYNQPIISINPICGEAFWDVKYFKTPFCCDTHYPQPFRNILSDPVAVVCTTSLPSSPSSMTRTCCVASCARTEMKCYANSVCLR